MENKIFVYLAKNKDIIKITRDKGYRVYIYRLDSNGIFCKWIGYNNDELAHTINYYMSIGYKLKSIC